MKVHATDNLLSSNLFFLFPFPTEIQLKRQERKRRSTCISPQNALDIDPEVSCMSCNSL